MVTAYVPVKTHTGDADRMRDAVADIDGVVDLIAKVNVESSAAVKSVAADGIHGVDTTQTCVSMD